MSHTRADSARTAGRWWRALGPVAALTAPALGFLLPFFGPWLSIAVVGAVVRRVGPRAWPAETASSRRNSLLANAALWLPGLLSLVLLLAVGEHMGSPETGRGLRLLSGVIGSVGLTYWLFLPLEGPDDLLTPALAALGVLALGAAVSVRRQTARPWLLGALAAPLTYAAVVHLLGIPFTG